ncbi:MAG: hypothetical protein C0412_21350, partial [Flavobacterium sp.]|nr:hypothetical protein [Flavobacterium sp.]
MTINTHDFTYEKYKNLLQEFINHGYRFILINDYPNAPSDIDTIVLRHDVDRAPENALQFAVIESNLGVKSTYYFRIVSESFHVEYIKKIIKLGHEIGYHYEDLSICKGNINSAIALFQKNLTKFRELYPVKSICMHGSPLSAYINSSIWKNIDYRQ